MSDEGFFQVGMSIPDELGDKVKRALREATTKKFRERDKNSVAFEPGVILTPEELGTFFERMGVIPEDVEALTRHHTRINDFTKNNTDDTCDACKTPHSESQYFVVCPDGIFCPSCAEEKGWGNEPEL